MSNTINKDTIPEGFSLPLVLVDAIPVILFGISMVLISLILASPLFLLGALLCLFAGVTKVIWKLIVVLKKKNIWWLFVQMRYLMPVGFICMIVGVVLRWKALDGAVIMAALTSVPAVIFFVIGILGMALMMVFAFTLDSSDVKSNWIEQITNGFAQLCFTIGLVCIFLTL